MRHLAQRVRAAAIAALCVVSCEAKAALAKVAYVPIENHLFLKTEIKDHNGAPPNNVVNASSPGTYLETWTYNVFYDEEAKPDWAWYDPVKETIRFKEVYTVPPTLVTIILEQHLLWTKVQHPSPANTYSYVPGLLEVKSSKQYNSYVLTRTPVITALPEPTHVALVVSGLFVALMCRRNAALRAQS